jgi:hypothetical protein
VLRRVAALVRPGGAILVRDLFDDPSYCRSEPPLPALARGYALLYAAVGHAGGARDVARRYRALCRDADLEVVEQRGLLSHYDAPAPLFDVLQAALLGMRPVLEAGGLSAAGEVAALADALEAAKAADFAWIHGPLMVDLFARVPAGAGAGRRG